MKIPLLSGVLVALVMADGESPLFLQVTEARASVLENYLEKSEFANRGQRVAKVCQCPLNV